MKKAILIMLSALLLISSFTACGNKKNNYDEDGYSRVLYDDNEEESSVEEGEEKNAEGESNAEKPDSKDAVADNKENNGESDSDKDKKSSDSDTSSKIRINNTSGSSSNASSKAASSKASSTASRTSTATSSRAASSRITVSSTPSLTSSNTVSSDLNSDTDTNTDTEWYDSDIEDTDSEDIVDTDSETEIEKGYFVESDMSFPVNYGQISVGQSFQSADDLLYGYNTVTEIAGGKIYYYNECEITTAGDEDNEYITNIHITSSSYAISKDIRIGSTTDDLLRAYGDPEYGYTYTWGNRSLNFAVSDDVITDISFS